MSNLFDVVEVCLEDLERGVDIETVLFGYPDLADELRPILETAAKAIQAPVPDPSTDVIRRNRARLLQKAAQMRETKVRPSRGLWTVPLRRALVSLVVIATLFIGSTSLVRAATMTLPGDNLYPVKRTLEDVRVLFTFNMQAREALEVENENERLEELHEVFAEGRSTEVDFAGVVTRQNGDMWLVAKIPVVISAQTDLRAESVVTGDAVRVRGVTQADGTVLAERVDRLDAGVPLPEVEDDPQDENASDGDNSGKGSGNDSESGPAESSLRGTVESVNGSIVIVNGQPMDISNADVIGTAAAGRRARVQGYYADNGVFIVTKIEFIRIGSSEDNSSSSDNGINDNNENHGDEDSNTNEHNDDEHNGNGEDHPDNNNNTEENDH